MKNKKIRIRFLINTLNIGGAEKCLIDLLNKLKPDKYETYLVTVKGGVLAGSVPSWINYKQLVKKGGFLSKLYSKLLFKLPSRLFRFLFMRQKCDVEVAYLEGFSTKIISSVKKKNVKTYAFIHTDVSATNFLKTFASKDECISQYANFTKTCFVSQTARDGFERVVGNMENACVIRNVIDQARILRESNDYCDIEYSTDSYKLVALGRLTEAKNYSMLINVAKRLEDNYSFELLIIGDGDLKTKLTNQIEKNAVKSVKLVGALTNPYPLLKKADLYVCSSKREGYSTAIVEALTLSLPVVTTECSGMNEILCDNKYGLIVENSEEALYSALKRILENREYYSNLKEKAEKWSRINNNSDLGEYESLFNGV